MIKSLILFLALLTMSIFFYLRFSSDVVIQETIIERNFPTKIPKEKIRKIETHGKKDYEVLGE